jgi:hypothetical protein
MKDGLPGSRTDVDHDAVVLEPRDPRCLRNELEHSLRLLRRKAADVAEGVDVAFRQHEQVRFGLRVDVADRDEAVSRVNVVALAGEAAKEAVRVSQRGSPPR